MWLLVNRANTTSTGPQLRPLPHPPTHPPTRPLRYYDCYRGVPLHPDTQGVLSFDIQPWGFACVLATVNTTTPLTPTEAADISPSRLRNGAPTQPQRLSSLLQRMASLTAQPLRSFTRQWTYLQQTHLTHQRTSPLRPPGDEREDEVYVPGGLYRFDSSSVEVEGASGSGVGVQFQWESHPQRWHSKDLHMPALYVDKYPVSNAQYAAYLSATGYHPRDDAHWLEGNFISVSNHSRVPRKGWELRPVTYVGLEDAKAYCSHHNKRLPEAYEWQYIAQGHDGRKYPWGDRDDLLRRPAPNANWTNPGPEPVNANTTTITTTTAQMVVHD